MGQVARLFLGLRFRSGKACFLFSPGPRLLLGLRSLRRCSGGDQSTVIGRVEPRAGSGTLLCLSI